MKKIIAVLSVFIILLAGIPSAYASETGRYMVTDNVLMIYSTPDTKSAVCGEVTRGQVLNITETDSDCNFGKAFFASLGITGWVEMKNLKSLETTPEKTDVKAIEITPPDKLEYIHNEDELNLTGMVVYALDGKGGKTPVTGYKVSAESFADTGEKTVTVSYSPAGSGKIFTASFTVTVVRQPVTGLTIINNPTKTVYKEHEVLDLTGLEADVSFYDRPSQRFTLSQILADSEFSFSQELSGKLEPGTHNITLSYKYSDITAAFTVTVTPRVITDLILISEPDSLVTYSKKNLPDISGLVVRAVYDNGETEDIRDWDCSVECSPSDFILGAGNEVVISYKGKTVTLYYTLAQNEIKGLYIVTPQVLTFRSGFDIDLSTLRVYYEYMDGSIEETKNYTISEINKQLMGTQNILITSGAYSEVFSIYLTSFFGLGDIDGNGKSDVTDARLALRSAIGFINLAGLTLNACDVDKDGKPTVMDARMILRNAIKLEDFHTFGKVILP